MKAPPRPRKNRRPEPLSSSAPPRGHSAPSLATPPTTAPRVHHQGKPTSREVIVLVGGHGGLEQRYRQIAEERGFALEHYEQRIPPKAHTPGARLKVVIVVVSMVSHSLMSSARKLAASGASIVYLRSPSVSAVRETVTRLAA